MPIAKRGGRAVANATNGDPQPGPLGETRARPRSTASSAP